MIMTKFEYMKIEQSDLSESDLNEYGNDGWRLVGVISVTTDYEVLENIKSFNYYFIRES